MISTGRPGAPTKGTATALKSTGHLMQPTVLISDALSPAAVAIFKDRGVKVEFQPSLGKDKE
jgi:hypothetical protein